MGVADYIALGIIIFLVICAVRYMIVSRKKSGCSGCCGSCTHDCRRSYSENEKQDN